MWFYYSANMPKFGDRMFHDVEKGLLHLKLIMKIREVKNEHDDSSSSSSSSGEGAVQNKFICQKSKTTKYRSISGTTHRSFNAEDK